MKVVTRNEYIAALGKLPTRPTLTLLHTLLPHLTKRSCRALLAAKKPWQIGAPSLLITHARGVRMGRTGTLSAWVLLATDLESQLDAENYALTHWAQPSFNRNGIVAIDYLIGSRTIAAVAEVGAFREAKPFIDDAECLRATSSPFEIYELGAVHLDYRYAAYLCQSCGWVLYPGEPRCEACGVTDDYAASDRVHRVWRIHDLPPPRMVYDSAYCFHNFSALDYATLRKIYTRKLILEKAQHVYDSAYYARDNAIAGIEDVEMRALVDRMVAPPQLLNIQPPAKPVDPGRGIIFEDD